MDTARVHLPPCIQGHLPALGQSRARGTPVTV